MKEQLEMDIDKLNDVLEASYEVSNSFSCKAYVDIKRIAREQIEYLEELLEKTIKEQSYEERIFDNPNFKVKVWQDNERIGIKTMFIRERFEYVSNRRWDNNYAGIRICAGWRTRLLEYTMPDFGLESATHSMLKNEANVFYSDIVKELEIAHAKSMEADKTTIYDVIKECEGITDKDEMLRTLDKYELKYKNRDFWNTLMNNVQALSNPIGFIANGHQIRRKLCTK